MYIEEIVFHTDDKDDIGTETYIYTHTHTHPQGMFNDHFNTSLLVKL